MAEPCSDCLFDDEGCELGCPFDGDEDIDPIDTTDDPVE